MLSSLRVFSAVLACLVMSSRGHPDTSIHGIIRDAETGRLLPYANIQVEGTLRGTISNREGEYALELDELPATVVVRYIGYESQRLYIAQDAPSVQNILLVPTVIELEPIVVTGEDPAVSIMRKVIERKQRWRKRLKTYRAEAYTRLVVENDTAIVFISESASEIYWDQKRGQREIVTSKRETSNISAMPIIASAGFIPNLYDDDVETMENDLIGPTHPRALDYYDFKLEERRARDDKIVYDISVLPKSTLQPTFSGRIAILDGEYAMIEADLKPGEAVLMPFPIQEWNVYQRQQFSNFDQDFWLPVDVRMEGDIKIGVTGLSFPTVKYHQLSRITDYQVNVPVPDSLYQQEKVISVDSLAVKQDTLFAIQMPVIPLTERESEAYTTIDTTMTLERAFRPTGFLAPFVRVQYGPDEQEGQEDRRGILSLFAPRIWHNRVDAFHLGLQWEKALTKRLQIQLGGAHKTGLRRWSYNVGCTYRFGKARTWLVAASFRAGSDTRYRSDGYGRAENSLLSLLGYEDYFDYFWSKGLAVELSHRVEPLSTVMSLQFRDENHTSLSKTTDYNLLGRDHDHRLNPSIQEGRLRSVELKIVVGDDPSGTDDVRGIVGQRRVELAVEHSSPHILSSQFSFTRYRLAVDWRIETFLRRRIMPNVLDLCVMAGTSRGHLPAQRWGIIDGRMGAFARFGALRSLRERPYEGEHHLALFWEHNFRTVPFELLGLRWPVRHGIGIILHGASGRTWISQSRLRGLDYAPQYQDGYHHEVGLSLNRLLGLFRLDATRRLDEPGFFVGFSFARIW